MTSDDHTSEGMVSSDKPEYDLNHIYVYIYIIRPKRMSSFLPRRLVEQVGALAAKLGWARPSIPKATKGGELRGRNATERSVGHGIVSWLHDVSTGEGQARHLVVS